MAQTDAYFRPETLSDALDVLGAAPVRIAAGCTDIFPATPHKALPGTILDITGIADLRGITQDETGLTIGATTTWSDLVRADLPPACYGLQRAAREVGALQIQNRGTVAGNLCNASPAADGVPPLLTLEAEVELRSATATRRLKLSDFLLGPRRTALEKDELLTAIHLPAHALKGQGHFLKLGARAYLVISISMVAARLVVADGRIAEAAISVGSCGPVATRLSALEQALIGTVPGTHAVVRDDIVTALSPIDDVRGDAGFRLTSTVALVQRTLDALLPEGAVA